MHTSRVLWAHHVAHHSSERFNLSTALRQPVADVLGVYLPYGVLCFAGIRPSMIEQARGLNLLYQFWIHTDLIPKLGKAEEVAEHGVAPPGPPRSEHPVHRPEPRLDPDRVGPPVRHFSREDDAEPVIYGLTKNIQSDNPAVIASHEFRDILRDVAGSDNWTDRFYVRAAGPGLGLRPPRRAGRPTRRADDLAPVTAGVA